MDDLIRKALDLYGCIHRRALIEHRVCWVMSNDTAKAIFQASPGLEGLEFVPAAWTMVGIPIMWNDALALGEIYIAARDGA